MCDPVGSFEPFVAIPPSESLELPAENGVGGSTGNRGILVVAWDKTFGIELER